MPIIRTLGRPGRRSPRRQAGHGFPQLPPIPQLRVHAPGQARGIPLYFNSRPYALDCRHVPAPCFPWGFARPFPPRPRITAKHASRHALWPSCGYGKHGTGPLSCPMRLSLPGPWVQCGQRPLPAGRMSMSDGPPGTPLAAHARPHHTPLMPGSRAYGCTPVAAGHDAPGSKSGRPHAPGPGNQDNCKVWPLAWAWCPPCFTKYQHLPTVPARNANICQHFTRERAGDRPQPSPPVVYSPCTLHGAKAADPPGCMDTCPCWAWGSHAQAGLVMAVPRKHRAALYQVKALPIAAFVHRRGHFLRKLEDRQGQFGVNVVLLKGPLQGAQGL